MQLSQDDDSNLKCDSSQNFPPRSPAKKRSRRSSDAEIKKIRGGSASNSDQETIQINIRNSPALNRMGKKKKSESSEDEVATKDQDKSRPRSPSPSPAKSR